MTTMTISILLAAAQAAELEARRAAHKPPGHPRGAVPTATFARAVLMAGLRALSHDDIARELCTAQQGAATKGGTAS